MLEHPAVVRSHGCGAVAIVCRVSPAADDAINIHLGSIAVPGVAGVCVLIVGHEQRVQTVGEGRGEGTVIEHKHVVNITPCGESEKLYAPTNHKSFMRRRTTN